MDVNNSPSSCARQDVVRSFCSCAMHVVVALQCRAFAWVAVLLFLERKVCKTLMQFTSSMQQL